MRTLVAQGLPPGMRVTIAGDGAETSALQALNLGSQLRLLGWSSQEVVLKNTLSADLVVVPSVWDEPCATTVIEALALSRHVFALARGGTPELMHLATTTGGSLLHLFDTMPDLVAALRGWARPQAAVRARADTFAGGMQAMADAVLAHYQRHFAVSPDRSSILAANP
jgi:glycogen synthase